MVQTTNETFKKGKKTFKKIKRGSGKNVYFTQDHQAAIEKYIVSKDSKERNHLYMTLIGPALSEMINNIVYTFKFTSLPNIDNLKEDCMHHLVTTLNKFDSERGSKAFSYFSLIVKNYFIQAVKKGGKKQKEEISIDESLQEVEYHLRFYKEQKDYIDERNSHEYNEFLKEEIKNWEEVCITENEKKVYYAFRQLFDNANSLEIVNKKAINLYIQELTGLEKKVITPILMKFFKELYMDAKYKWQNLDY